jgi:TLP18.3/Psb32/MOLO-1 phosphatase superfamily protein
MAEVPLPANGAANGATIRLHLLGRGVARLAVAILILCALSPLAYAFDFPALTGRVVDQANIMTPQSRAAVETKLKDLEDKSSIQLVVATVKSLQGGDIETYANELFRFWKLGEAKKNNRQPVQSAVPAAVLWRVCFRLLPDGSRRARLAIRPLCQTQWPHGLCAVSRRRLGWWLRLGRRLIRGWI